MKMAQCNCIVQNVTRGKGRLECASKAIGTHKAGLCYKTPARKRGNRYTEFKIIQGNARTNDGILSELKRIENGKSVDGDLLAIIETVAKTYNGLQEK